MLHEATNSSGATAARHVEGEDVPHLAGVAVGWGCNLQVRFFFIGQTRRGR